MLLVLATGCQQVVITKPPPVPIPPDSKLVCIFFDDAFQNQYEVALPVLLEYDFKATFGVITDHVDTGYDLWEYMDIKELKELANYGMDIACHTKTHPDLTTISDEQLYDEIIESKKDLENMGFEVSTMVYPYYEWNNKVISYTIEAGFIWGRAGWTEGYVYDITTNDVMEKYHVTAWQISNQDIDTFKIIVGRANGNSIVCLVYHFITNDGPEETSTPLANFLEQMAYLHDEGYTVIPLSDLFK